MVMRYGLSTIALAVALQASPADACRDPRNVEPFFHEIAPEEGAGDFIAEVEIVREVPTQIWIGPADDRRSRQYESPTLEARVLRHIRGDARIEYVRISAPLIVSSCWAVARPGGAGILVGTALSHVEDGTIVVAAIRGPSPRERDQATAR